jgi:hypothetical protein
MVIWLRNRQDVDAGTTELEEGFTSFQLIGENRGNGARTAYIADRRN